MDVEMETTEIMKGMDCVHPASFERHTRRRLEGAVYREYSWLLEEPLHVWLPILEVSPERTSRVLVWDAGDRWSAILTINEEGRLLVNGNDIDWGDDFPVLLGIMDAAIESDTQEEPVFLTVWTGNGATEVSEPSNAGRYPA